MRSIFLLVAFFVACCVGCAGRQSNLSVSAKAEAAEDIRQPKVEVHVTYTIQMSGGK